MYVQYLTKNIFFISLFLYFNIPIVHQAKALLEKDCESRPCFSSEGFLVLFSQSSLHAANENGGPSSENASNNKSSSSMHSES